MLAYRHKSVQRGPYLPAIGSGTRPARKSAAMAHRQPPPRARHRGRTRSCPAIAGWQTSSCSNRRAPLPAAARANMAKRVTKARGNPTPPPGPAVCAPVRHPRTLLSLPAGNPGVEPPSRAVPSARHPRATGCTGTSAAVSMDGATPESTGMETSPSPSRSCAKASPSPANRPPLLPAKGFRPLRFPRPRPGAEARGGGPGGAPTPEIPYRGLDLPGEWLHPGLHVLLIFRAKASAGRQGNGQSAVAIRRTGLRSTAATVSGPHARPLGRGYTSCHIGGGQEAVPRPAMEGFRTCLPRPPAPAVRSPGARWVGC